MIRRVLLTVGVMALLAPALHAAPADPAARPRPVARVVLAMYDGALELTPRDTTVHALAEMPLNHLGLLVKYHDIRNGLPKPEALAGVRGVITWFTRDAMRDPVGYLRWVEGLAGTGTPLVVMGVLGALADEDGTPTPRDEVNRVLARLGWRFDGGWHTTNAGAVFAVRDRRLIGFERQLPRLVPPYATVRAVAADARVALAVSMPGRSAAASDLVVVSPRGAYVAPGYAYFSDRTGDRDFRQWYLNPFEFFREAYHTDDLPKLDTATLSGRRIYYSHIDGDGWRNLTQIEPHRSRYVLAARVVLDELIRKFPDLPVTVGAIAGDLDPAWKGTAQSLAVARELYQLPQVEAAIHTYSHPLDWGFFDAGVQRTADGGAALRGPDVIVDAAGPKARSYDTRPFSLALEVDGARAYVESLLPAGKRVALLQWSGDTRPFPRALAQARRAGLPNINGGDTRFDREFPSIAWVSPLGAEIGGQLQVYASNSNENTYTDLWRNRYFGFSFLTRTVRNTGYPRRLKPFNLYYHVYSGERLSSLNAVLANLAYARSLPLAPIEASRFSRIVEGFFSAELHEVGPRAWRVGRRGALQTLRFDAASLDGVDFDRSIGVVGQRHELGSLYVALDEQVDAPLVVLKPIEVGGSEPLEAVPYLVESRWRVFGVGRGRGTLRFLTEGYGPGEIVWSWPLSADVVVTWQAASGRTGTLELRRDASGLLRMNLPQLTGERVEVLVAAKGGHRASR